MTVLSYEPSDLPTMVIAKRLLPRLERVLELQGAACHVVGSAGPRMVKVTILRLTERKEGSK